MESSRVLFQSGRGGARARARALEEEAADEITYGNDGVQRAGNIGERMVGGDEARLDMLVEAAALVGAVAFGHADQADAVAQRFGLANVGGDQEIGRAHV